MFNMEWESSKRWVKKDMLAMLQSILSNEGILCMIIRILASRGGNLKYNFRRRKKGEQGPKFRTEVLAQGNVSYAERHLWTPQGYLEVTWIPLDVMGPKSDLQ